MSFCCVLRFKLVSWIVILTPLYKCKWVETIYVNSCRGHGEADSDAHHGSRGNHNCGNFVNFRRCQNGEGDHRDGHWDQQRDLPSVLLEDKPGEQRRKNCAQRNSARCKDNCCVVTWRLFIIKWANPGLFLFFVFSNTLQILQQICMWKNVHPVYGAGIRTHNLWNMSLLP